MNKITHCPFCQSDLVVINNFNACRSCIIQGDYFRYLYNSFDKSHCYRFLFNDKLVFATYYKNESLEIYESSFHIINIKNYHFTNVQDLENYVKMILALS